MFSHTMNENYIGNPNKLEKGKIRFSVAVSSKDLRLSTDIIVK